MPRIGKYTGAVYQDDYDFSKCPECCTVVTTEQASDEHYRTNLVLRNLLDCSNCRGCPAAIAD